MRRASQTLSKVTLLAHLMRCTCEYRVNTLGVRFWWILVFLVSTSSAQAGTTVVGYEIGVTDRASVVKALGESGALVVEGKHLISGGDVLRIQNKPRVLFDVDGLLNVKLVFSDRDVLSSVWLEIHSDFYNSTLETLKAKYRNGKNLSLPNSTLKWRFSTKDAIIEFESPRGLFAIMQVRYTSNRLFSAIELEKKTEELKIANKKKSAL